MSEDLKVKLEGYLRKAEPLFSGLEAETPKNINPASAKRFKEMALSYYSDARHFHESGEYASALAALEYAEGWLDAGKELGIFKGKK